MEFDINTSIEILLTIETILLIISLFISALFYFSYRSARQLSALLDETLNSSEAGKIIFCKNGYVKKANQKAMSYLSTLIQVDPLEMTRGMFVDCLYDHAADFDESIRNTLLSDMNDVENAPEFREVIYCPKNGLCLVDARALADGITLFSLSDISGGQKREKDLIELNAFNRQLIQAIQATTSGIIVGDAKDKDNPILFANDAFCSFTGSQRQDLIGANWNILMSMFSDMKERDKFLNALSGKHDAELNLELEADDSIRYFSMKFSPVKDNDGSIDLFIGVLSEVTLLKQRESEFFHAQKLESLGQLAAGVAHDFNNILSIIGGYSVMAAKKLEREGHDEVVSFLGKIDAAADRGAGLTRKMLTFSRHKVVARTVVNVCDVVQEQKELMVPLLGVSIDMDVSMPEHDVNVQGNADSLGQILMNLAINARDAILPERGTLSVKVACLDVGDVPKKVKQNIEGEDIVCISVSDTGTGMDEKTIDKIFDPFFSTKEQGKGTGLGLSVVYGLVREMGGFLDVSSKLGEGTTMYFYVPRTHEGQTKTIAGDGSDLSTICLDGYTALVAEDEPDLLNLVTNMLEDLGLNVIGACNGNDALSQQDDYLDDIDILLTDVVMPEMNGVKLAELFSSLRPDTKIIFMSGYPANGDMAPVALPEKADFIAKPVDYNNLASLILQRLREGAGGAANVDAMPYWETTSEGEVS